MDLEGRVELLAFDRLLAESRTGPVDDDDAAAQDRRASFVARLALERQRIHGEA